MPKIKTERSWLQSTTPGSLLLALRGRDVPRQRRLIAVACCRRWLDKMDEDSRRAVEVAERYADGQASAEELTRAYQAMQPGIWLLLSMNANEPIETWRQRWLTYAAGLCCRKTGMEEACDVLLRLARRAGKDEESREKAAQCQLIRDILGNPFREPLLVAPAWLTWNGGLIAKMAEAIHHERRFTDMPILADALEEAGCADEQILSHCRAGAAHARGCWAVDLLLGRAREG